jgi:3-oxoacyl-[acyl-carrier protein] reductase
MSGDLSGKAALVTGASRGIGRAIALELARRGASVSFSYGRSSEQAEGVRQEIEALGARAVAFQSDVANFEAARQLVADVREALGGLDILVNNAGITRDKLILQMTEADWDAVVDTNLKGVFNVTKHVAQFMIKQRRGRIVNIGSISGTVGLPGQTNYSASKAGLVGFTRALAKEVGRRNVTCNTLALGMVETEMTAALGEEYLAKMVDQIALRRFAKPEEVARIVAFFCSDDSAYITGQVITVDGGLAA